MRASLFPGIRWGFAILRIVIWPSGYDALASPSIGLDSSVDNRELALCDSLVFLQPPTSRLLGWVRLVVDLLQLLDA